jgi:hypothetical protein
VSELTGTDKPPPKRQIHLLADFIELRCAISESGAFSTEELQDVRKRADHDKVEDEEVSLRELFFEDEQPDAALAAALDVESSEVEPSLKTAPDDPAEERSAGESAQDDLRELEASDVVRHIEYRIATYGDAYPFRLRDDAVIELLDDLTPSRQLYLFLLVAANLKYVRRQQRKQELTKYFELLGPDVLRGYLGPRAEVELFGTSTDALAAPRYTGSLWEKLVALGVDLRAQVVAIEEDVEDAGDFGVDVVAWFPFADDAEGRFVTVLAQCACGRKWFPKISEPTAEALVEVMTFKSPIVNVVLIPQCYRATDGKWFKRRGMRTGVLLDRQRIFQSLRALGVDLPADGAYPTAFMDEILSGVDE